MVKRVATLIILAFTRTASAKPFVAQVTELKYQLLEEGINLSYERPHRGNFKPQAGYQPYLKGTCWYHE